VKLGWLGAAALVLTACAKDAPPPKPPALVKPPTPATVSVAQPGGDAADPHQAALLRQLQEPWGARNDKDDQVHAPTPDWENWKRVRYWGVEHFTGFRYGKDHHVVAIVFVHEAAADKPHTSETCMRSFEAWGRPQLKSLQVKFEPFQAHQSRFRGRPLSIHSVDGSFSTGFTTTRFSAAWAAYAAYPNACLIYAMAAPWRDHGELAQKVRDRWVNEGFKLMRPRTPEAPTRKP
jgi:hypothetical protein